MTRRLLAALALTLWFGAALAQDKGLETATFAGGCFWCVESDFDKVPGVVSTTSGYTGGHKANPTYHEVSAGGTGHAESVEIKFDPKVVSYRRLLEVYWHSIDPRGIHFSPSQYATPLPVVMGLIAPASLLTVSKSPTA